MLRRPCAAPRPWPAVYQFPSYFHLQNVLLHGEFVESARAWCFAAASATSRSSSTTPRAQRRLRRSARPAYRHRTTRARRSARACLHGSPDPERWPRPGEELVRQRHGRRGGAARDDALLSAPSRFSHGDSRGRTSPSSGSSAGATCSAICRARPAKSRYDFVLRSADAAVWVTDLRPRGRGFDLSVEARVDTGRWLQVTGTVSQDRGPGDNLRDHRGARNAAPGTVPWRMSSCAASTA